jgi:hypothetical protein
VDASIPALSRGLIPVLMVIVAVGVAVAGMGALAK